ncbi:TAXI family TRAP transporter solute-binding subunit [Phytoactinopolyspora mesophila]|uniref:TAXI family TRAP transporter solute-binding subunit n=1 Tax=Phytoactinopolyspora mesophila TaxID=2650750 RepID=A0A7K3LYL5_9ACTN|nr:TAXI family TRAP transporter solute-binding subunit [Phytoactinopolyspora mesophila]
MTGRRSGVISGLGLVVLLVVVACTGGGDQAPGSERHVIAGGGTTGVYYNYGRYLAASMSEELDLTVVVAESNGSVENLEQVAAGEALLGFTQGDTAVDAVGGHPPFDEPLPIRAVARVYDEFVHVVVPEDSAIEELADLRGRRVSLGASGSGTEIISQRILRAADLDLSELENASLGIDGSIEALLAGEVDAFIWVGGLPTPGLSSLESQMSIRLLPVEEQVDEINADHGGVYRHAVVPKGMYGIRESVPAMAVPNYLVVSSETPDELVYETLGVLFDERLSIARHVPAAGLLDRRRAIFTEPVELHEAAAQYYRDTKH